jgi:hypothetical protein
MQGAAGLDFQHRFALAPCPPPYIRAGIAIGQGGLAQDRMLIGDVFGGIDQLAGSLDQAFLDQRLRPGELQKSLRGYPLARFSLAPIRQHAGPPRPAFRARLCTKPCVLRDLSTSGLGRKPRAVWGVRARALWGATL